MYGGIIPDRVYGKEACDKLGETALLERGESLSENGPGELDIELDTHLCRWPPSRAHTNAKTPTHTGFSAATFIFTGTP